MNGQVEKVGGVEVQGQSGHLKRRQILIADSEGTILEFVLWDEQILLANLFRSYLIFMSFHVHIGHASTSIYTSFQMVRFGSQGSMIALDKPFIARDSDCGIETTAGICLEYGSATRLYSVPYVHREEQVRNSLGLYLSNGGNQRVIVCMETEAKNHSLDQVIVGSSQNWSQSTRPLNMSNGSAVVGGSEEFRISQVTLPCNSQGSVDFSNFPFRVSIVLINTGLLVLFCALLRVTIK
eukprot:Gb_12457 [translate_table: standard]